MEKINGIVKSIRKDKTAVCITWNNEAEGNALENEWFSLGEKVKPEYISVGSSCEASVVENEEGGGNRIVTFIKCEKPKTTQQPQQQSFKTADTVEGISINEPMQRMSALKASSRIYEGTGKEQEFKRLTNEVIQFIQEGVWTEKV